MGTATPSLESPREENRVRSSGRQVALIADGTCAYRQIQHKVHPQRRVQREGQIKDDQSAIRSADGDCSSSLWTLG